MTDAESVGDLYLDIAEAYIDKSESRLISSVLFMCSR